MEKKSSSENRKLERQKTRIFKTSSSRESKATERIIVETSGLNPSVMCTSKSNNNWRQIDFDQIV